MFPFVHKLSLLILWILCAHLLVPGSSWAVPKSEKAASPPAKQTDDSKAIPKPGAGSENREGLVGPTLPERLLESNRKISEKIDKVAEDIDITLTGKKVTDKPNESSIVVENSAFWSEASEFESGIHFNVNLRLPNLEKKWSLRFTSYDEQEEDRGLDRRQFRQEPKEREYGGSFALFRRLGNIDVNFEPRIQLTDPLEVSYILNLQSEAEMDDYTVEPELEFFAEPSKGVGLFGSISVGFELNPVYGFSVIQEGEYQDHENLFSSNTGFVLGRKIGKRSSLSYSLVFASHNNPEYHLSQYGIDVGFEQEIYKDALKYSVTPGLDFAKSRSFKGNTGIELRVFVIF